MTNVSSCRPILYRVQVIRSPTVVLVRCDTFECIASRYGDNLPIIPVDADDRSAPCNDADRVNVDDEKNEELPVNLVEKNALAADHSSVDVAVHAVGSVDSVNPVISIDSSLDAAYAVSCNAILF